MNKKYSKVITRNLKTGKTTMAREEAEAVAKVGGKALLATEGISGGASFHRNNADMSLFGTVYYVECNLQNILRDMMSKKYDMFVLDFPLNMREIDAVAAVAEAWEVRTIIFAQSARKGDQARKER